MLGLLQVFLRRISAWRAAAVPLRRHSTIGYLSPVEFEKRALLA